jgi:hypothetical protein
VDDQAVVVLGGESDRLVREPEHACLGVGQT